MPEYAVLDKDTIKNRIMPYLSVAKRGYASQCPFLKLVDSVLDVYCLLFTLCLCGVDWSGTIPWRS